MRDVNGLNMTYPLNKEQQKMTTDLAQPSVTSPIDTPITDPQDCEHPPASPCEDWEPLKQAAGDFSEMSFEDIKRYLTRVGKVILSPRPKLDAFNAAIRWYMERQGNEPLTVEYESSLGLVQLVADGKGLGIWLQIEEDRPGMTQKTGNCELLWPNRP